MIAFWFYLTASILSAFDEADKKYKNFNKFLTFTLLVGVIFSALKLIQSDTRVLLNYCVIVLVILDVINMLIDYVSDKYFKNTKNKVLMTLFLISKLLLLLLGTAFTGILIYSFFV